MSSRQFVLSPTSSIYYTHGPPHAPYHDPALASLGYGQLQLPLQHQFQATAEQQQHAQHQQQLSLAAAASGFQQQQQHIQQIPIFQHHHQFHQHFPIRQHPQTRQQSRVMASDYQNATDEDMAHLQKLSNEYEPEVTGPLVGQRQLSTAITTEYASADPVFQAKTAALPQKYSHYRAVRGDGLCGWRAVAFGYFETLIHYGDANKFVEEETRLRSLSNVLNAAGFSSMLYEDFADVVFDLIRKVAKAQQEGNAEEVLLEAFNDASTQNYVITHFKTLTAAWMKTRPQDYAPWLLGQTVEEFCSTSVMPMGSEIENVGLTALKDVCLSPAGITLEVLYLDRSEGDEVNMHRFSPVNHGGYDVGTIRLLYRPGHYDLLYTLQDLPASSAPVATYLQFASHDHEPVYDLGNQPDFMTMIPGMSYANPHQGWISSSSYTDSDFFPTPAPMPSCAPVVPTPAAPAPQQELQPQPVYVPATPTQLVAPPNQITQELAIRPVPHASMQSHHGFQQQLPGPFRPSAWELEEGFAQTMCHTPFQTSIFRNSHYNTAHFQNPDFQPEEWRPEDEYITTSSRSSRHRSSG